MNKVLHTLLFFITLSVANAQNAKIEGRVTDEKGEGLIQANIIIDAAKGLATVTDFDGNYELSVPAGTYQVTYRYVGKEEQKFNLTLAAGEKKTQNVTLKEKARMMDQVVVSGSKYEKKLTEETVSMDVMKGTTFIDQNITSLDNGVSKISSVTIADGQANIRGGAGWSYGAGSRVAVLYDDLPITTADADDAKWSAIPVENIEQVEVIKGAASALYGSGALDGIINARIAMPTDQPYTRVQTYFGLYGNPAEGDMRWWLPGQLQYFSGFNAADRRKLGQFDLVTSVGFTTDRGYLDSSDAHDLHVDEKLRWRPKNVDGLNVGIDVVAYYSWGKQFFIWDSIGNKGYEPLGGTVTIYHDGRYVITPFLNYYDKKDNRFSFKYRYLNSTNLNTTGQGSIGQRSYAELQYGKMMKALNLNILAGAVGIYDVAHSPPGDSISLIGNHNRSNLALYAQVDKKVVGDKKGFKSLNAVIGARWEYFTISPDSTGQPRRNSLKDLTYPLGRIGLNYQAADFTFIRASAGMGFRYPALAELYIHTYLGPIGVFSNPNLQPEKSYSGELGLKQGFKISNNWTGYGDLALFINQYDNMMEFTFGQFGPRNLLDVQHDFGLGFSSQNIGKARIMGTEITAALHGTIGQVEMNFMAGYTFLDPRALDWNKPLTLYNQSGDTVKPYFLLGTVQVNTMYNQANVDQKSNPGGNQLTYAMTSSYGNNILKYRSRNQFKLVYSISWRKWDLNIDYQYFAYQQNIDYAFVSPLFQSLEPAFQGLANWRAQKEAAGSKGDNIVNAAIGFKPVPKFKIAAIVKNISNTQWMTRPGMFQAPRNYTVQLTYTF